MYKQDLFPLTVFFEDGSSETYQDEDDIVCNLEWFDSDKDTNCKVVDRFGRTVFIILENLTLKEIHLMSKSNDAP